MCAIQVPIIIIIIISLQFGMITNLDWQLSGSFQALNESCFKAPMRGMNSF